MGAEFEVAWQPVRFVRFDAAFSYGIWEYTDDVSGTYIIDFATENLKIINFILRT